MKLEIADIIGIENLKKLSIHFGGSEIYIPTLSSIERDERNERITELFAEKLRNGSTCMSAYHDLAIDTGLSFSRIRQITS